MIVDMEAIKRRNRRILVTWITLVALAACFLAYRMLDAEAHAKPRQHAVGVTMGDPVPIPTAVALGGSVAFQAPHGAMRMTVGGVRRKSSCGPDDPPVKAGYEFLVVYLYVQVTSGRVNTDPFEWSLDQGGTDVPQSFADCTEAAGSGRWPHDDGLMYGVAMPGIIVFEIPRGSAGTVVWSPVVNPVATWGFS